MMERRALGRTGLSVGVMGLGGAGLGNVYGAITDEQAVATVHRAIELGVDYIDTAPLYGESERRLGLALDGCRDRVVLATKCGYRLRGGRVLEYDEILTEFDLSLERLRAERVDILQFHEIQPEIADRVLADDGPLGAMLRLQAEGRCRWLGVTGRNPDCVAGAVATGAFEVALTYLEYSPLTLSAQERLFPVAAETGTSVVVGSPLAAGLLTGVQPAAWAEGKRWPNKEQVVARAEQVHAVARRQGVGVPELTLAFELADPRVTVLVPGAKSVAEIEQNVAAAECRLAPELVAEIREIALS